MRTLKQNGKKTREKNVGVLTIFADIFQPRPARLNLCIEHQVSQGVAIRISSIVVSIVVCIQAFYFSASSLSTRDLNRAKLLRFLAFFDFKSGNKTMQIYLKLFQIQYYL